MGTAESKPLDAAVIREAARWLVRLHSGEAGPADHAAFERWRLGSPERELAWQRAQRLSQHFKAVPPALGVPLLTRPGRVSRRTVLSALALGLTLPGAGWLAYRLHDSDGRALRTAVGENHDWKLADGSQAQLNTDSKLAVRFSGQMRLLHLQSGEVYVRTAPDPGGRARPFVVETPQGLLRALGTRFVVRRVDADTTELTVLEHRVAVTLLGNPAVRTFSAGESVRFTAQAFAGNKAAMADSPGWTRGVIEADNMRLDALLAEVSRYRRGVVRCDDAVAGLRVSGVFRLQNTDDLLAMVARTLDLRVVTRTSYWVSLGR